MAEGSETGRATPTSPAANSLTVSKNLDSEPHRSIEDSGFSGSGTALLLRPQSILLLILVLVLRGYDCFVFAPWMREECHFICGTNFSRNTFDDEAQLELELDKNSWLSSSQAVQKMKAKTQKKQSFSLFCACKCADGKEVLPCSDHLKGLE